MAQIGDAGGGGTDQQAGLDCSETPLVAEFDVKIPGWASTAGQRVWLRLRFLPPVKRACLNTPAAYILFTSTIHFVKDDDITIELPSGWQVSSVPAPQDQNGKVVVTA